MFELIDRCMRRIGKFFESVPDQDRAPNVIPLQQYELLKECLVVNNSDTVNKMGITTKHACTLGIIGLFAISVSIFMMYIALEHNPMGEFREYPEHPGEREGQINWPPLLELGFLWFIASFLVIFLMASILKLAVKLISG